MTVVRELVTLMGYKVDGKSEKKAQSSVDGLKKAGQALSALFLTGAVATGLQKVIDLGSDAVETMNVITTSFEDQTAAVLQWAGIQSKELGRSEFLLREYAATLGAILQPMTGSADAAAEMSTTLAQLTVDLGSFFNAAEPDVLLALRSGISGEAEPLKRFGIVMSVAALDVFAFQQNIGKTTKQMTEAEKVTLRYQFILAKTTKAQGDAARTAGGYANLTKALTGVVTDLATRFGMELLPAAEGVLMVLIGLVRTIGGPALSIFRTFRSAIAATVRTLNDMIESLTGIESGLQKYAAVAVAAWAIATAPILVTITLLALVSLGIATLIEDLDAMGDGGESVLGGLVGEFQLWLEETDSVFVAIGEIIATAVDFWADKLFGFTTELSGKFAEAFKEIGERWETEVMDRLNFFLRFTPTGIVQQQAALAQQGAQTITNSIDVVVNAPGVQNAGELAAQTAARVDAGAGRLMRRTANLLAVGGQ